MKNPFENIRFPALLLVALIIFALIFNLSITTENQFNLLLASILNGNLHLPYRVTDSVYYKGLYYWPLGPFPALFLLPFSYFSLIFYNSLIPQGIVNFLCVAFIILLAYRISSKFGFNKNNSVWISIALVFSSVFFLSAYLPWCWYFSQTVAFLFGLLSFIEFLGKKRYLLIGIFHGFLFMTRFTAGFGVLFYLLQIVFSRDLIKQKIENTFKMLIPIILSGILLLLYNYARFGNAFDNGYTIANNWIPNQEVYRYEMLHYGLFSVKNIPTNIYYYFINMPAPVLERLPDFDRRIFATPKDMIVHLVFPYIKVRNPGVSFFVVSIIFILMFRNKLKTCNSRYALITSMFITLFLLTYYWTGWIQIGPRYMIDLLPFLFIIFLESFEKKEVLFWQKLIILVGAVFNIFLFYTLTIK